MYFVHFVSAKNKQYFYNNVRNEPVGPLSFDQLRSLSDMGRIGQHTWVKEKHQTEWKKLSDVLREEEAAEKAAVPTVKPSRGIDFSPSAPTTATPAPTPAPRTVPVPPPSDIPQPSFVRAQSQPVPKLQFQKPREPQPQPAKAPIKQFVQEYIKESVKEQTTREPQKIVVERPPLPKIESYDIEKIQEISNTSTISGIVNILVGCLWLGLGSVFTMIHFAFALPPALYCIMTGVFEVTYASNLLVKQTGSLKQARILAFLSIFSCFCGNLVSSILGLKNLLSYNDYRVRAFFQ